MRQLFVVIKKCLVSSTLLALAALPLHAQEAQLTCCPEQPAAAKQKLLWQKLQQDVAKEVEDIDGVMAIGIYDLKTGTWVMAHGDEVMPQASSIKITVLLELYRQVQQGKLKMEDPYIVRQEDIVQDSDMLGALSPGARITLRDLATMMMAVSDNGATNVLIDRVGMDNVNRTLQELGLRTTKLRRKMMDLKAAGEGRENISTVREMVTLLRLIYEGKVLNPQLTGDFWKMLATYKKDSHMRKAVPDDVVVASKHGWLEGVRAESGVIFVKERPIVISVMTTYLHDEKDGEKAIGRITKKAFNYFDRVGRATEYGRVVSTK